ncbi:acetyl-CoA synthetase-like protein [Clavulina sp. PMI_390]|nr:acetyl-CoA synthetase-like protein [Clavulina sp. PMI_390]
MSPSLELLARKSKFQPTPASVPPKNVVLRLTVSPGALPVNRTPLNPVQFLLRAALICPDKLALAHPNVKHPVYYTYAVFTQRVQNFAYALKARGIQPGERIIIIAPNCPMIAEAHHAILAARAIICPPNIRLTKDVVDYIIEHSGAKLIIVDHEFTHLVDKNSSIPVIVSHDTGKMDDPYEQFLESGRKFSNEAGWAGLDMEMDEDAPATLCYTSGTTGRPKGVISTLRGSYLAAIANAFETKMGRSSVYLWILPMFHASGWTYPWAITFAFSAQITLRVVDPNLIWDHLLHSGVTHYCAAPTVQISIVNSPKAKRLDASRNCTAIIAGAAPTAHLIGQLEKLRIEVTHVYGLTETYGPFTRNYYRPSNTSSITDADTLIMARQGHSFVTADEVRVVYQPTDEELAEEKRAGPRGGLDVELRDVPKDGKTLGEIVVRGNIVMKEYFNDPEATRKAFRGSHFGSGDLAVRNPDGSISILDRSKDLIISGGENASSLSIEQELAKHPDVREVAVVARSHPKWGERAMAFVDLHLHSPFHPRKKTSSHEEFETHLKKFSTTKLPGFARPEWVMVVEELPKTGTGKVLKHVLREKARKIGEQEDGETKKKVSPKL